MGLFLLWEIWFSREQKKNNKQKRKNLVGLDYVVPLCGASFKLDYAFATLVWCVALASLFSGLNVLVKTNRFQRGLCSLWLWLVLAVLFACPFSKLFKDIHVVALRAIFSIIRLPRACVWKYGALALACPFYILGNLQLTSMLPQCWRICILRLCGLSSIELGCYILDVT